MIGKILALSISAVALVGGASASAQAPVTPTNASVKAGVVNGVQRATPTKGRVNNQFGEMGWEFWAFVSTGVVAGAIVAEEISNDDGASD